MEFGRIDEGTAVIQIFRGISLHEYGTSFEEQFAHEVGHLVARKEFGSIDADEWGRTIKGENPVSLRGGTSFAEDFAESYSLYLNGALDKNDYPIRYSKIKNIVDKASKGYFVKFLVDKSEGKS